MLAQRYSVKHKTTAKWRERQGVENLLMGPRERRSITLTPLEVAASVAFRVQTRPPLDDVFCALEPCILPLTCSALQRHGVS